MNGLRITRVGDNEYLASFWILQGHVLDILHFADGLKPLRPAPHMARKMLERPVLSAVGNFLRLRMNRDHPPARERTNIGLAFFVERKIPSGDRLRPVTQDLSKRFTP